MLKLFHGSSVRVERPVFGVGNPYNDYGLGFYCTTDRDLACEWACPRDKDGFVNAYELDDGGLAVCNLAEEDGGVLAWLSVLLAHRRFDVSVAVMCQVRDYVLERYPIDVDGADVVVGYRADDSYFSFARAFLDNRIALRQLERAILLGNPRGQVVLRSECAFERLRFLGAEPVLGREWHEHRMARDARIRREYQEIVSEESIGLDDVFAADLVRGR